MRFLLLILLLPALVLGYGHWHASTHGTLNISLYDYVGGETYSVLKDTSIMIRDSNGKLLATGQSDAQYGTVYLAHPDTGSCYEAERQATRSRSGMNAWQNCFKQYSTWIMEWIDEARFVDVQVAGCRLNMIPVSVKDRGAADWLLWWVPLPHVGGKPYTYFSLTLRIDPLQCRAMDQADY